MFPRIQADAARGDRSANHGGPLRDRAGHQSRASCGHSIFQVVPTGQGNPVAKRKPLDCSIDPRDVFLAVLKNAVAPEIARAEPQCASERLPAGDVLIVLIENRRISGRLPAEDALLRAAIFGKAAVPVEMVRAEIGDDGHVGAGGKTVEIVELKATQFEDGPFLRGDVVNFRKQAASDVSTESAGEAGGLQNRVGHRRRG